MGLEAKNPFENDELFRADEVQPTDTDDLDGGAEPVELLAVHHVALAVPHLDEAIDAQRETFGVTVEAREILAEEEVEVALLDVGGAYLQLIAPTSEESWVAELLEAQGPGLSHVGYRVADCAAALAALADRGYEIVDDEPRPGVGGTRVAYVHPPDQPGMLIQLVEE